MGNAPSKDRHDDNVDFGALTPQGIYTGPQDWNQGIVAQCIVDRKLAPFYRPLEDYQENWDDDQILAARKELPPPPPTNPGQPFGPHQDQQHPVLPTPTYLHRPTSSKSARAASKEPQRLTEARVYRDAVECPICFLYYPPNINRSRCCDQAICTECFVQIKRSEPTPTHLVSDPACCPYCVQENFGVVYNPPPWRTGIGSDAALPPRLDLYKTGSSSHSGDGAGGPVGSAKTRRKSMSHMSEEVVTIDQIRPDWEQKLNQVRAAVARRAQRQFIMRQVGDRLIPVGITSRRIPALEEGGDSAEDSSGRRSRRRPHGNNGELGHLLGSMGISMGGQDLEEMLLQEAMRLSLLEHEAEQKKQALEKQKRDQSSANGDQSDDNAGPSGSADHSTSLTSHDPLTPSTADGSPRPRSIVSARTPSPRPRSFAPVSPSPLANASAAVAMGIGLPGSAMPRGNLNTSNSLLAPESIGNGSGSSHPSQRSSRSHSRHPSSSSATPAFSTVAAAIGAANIASAFIALNGAPGSGSNEGGSVSRTETPPLPVLVGPNDLFEDVITPRVRSSLDNAGTSSSGSELPTNVPGVTATSTDIPSPGQDGQDADPRQEQPSIPASSADPLNVPLPSSDKSSPLPTPPSEAVAKAPSTVDTEGDDVSTEDELAEDSVRDYRILPSTPNLAVTEPLLVSETSSTVDRTRATSVSSRLD